MTSEVSLQPELLVDPRGAFLKAPVALAPRLSKLNESAVLLFDNSQQTTELPTFGPIFRWVSEFLEIQHKAKCSYETRNLLKGSRDDLVKLAEEIAQSGIEAVVIALCKGGVTGPTSLFAAELERKGIPCVQICTALGYPLAGVTAARYVPGLPIVLVQPATGDKDNFGKSETAAIGPEIVFGLTSAPAALNARFLEHFTSEVFSIAENGRIQLPSIRHAAKAIEGRTVVKVDPGRFAEDLYEALCAADLCDGFPVIPPTEGRVEGMFAFTDLDPDDVLLGEMPPSGASITVRSLAANAVMAGCRPEYFPILVTAIQAISDPAYRIFQGAITTHPSGNAVIISGPLAAELGIHSGPGCLGPGFRANATIGRAINLTIMNVARAIPGKTDLSLHGSPAEFTYCFAEAESGNPWQPLHTELFGPQITSVTVHKCEGPHNVLDPRAGPEDLLRTIAATAATPGGNSLVHLGQLLVILNPGQAEKVAKAGWSKQDVKEFLFETARHPLELARQQGARASFPPYFLKLPRVPVMKSAEDVIVVVCGGRGGHAMVGVPWGRARAVSRPVAMRNGTPILNLKTKFR